MTRSYNCVGRGNYLTIFITLQVRESLLNPPLVDLSCECESGSLQLRTPKIQTSLSASSLGLRTTWVCIRSTDTTYIQAKSKCSRVNALF